MVAKKTLAAVSVECMPAPDSSVSAVDIYAAINGRSVSEFK